MSENFERFLQQSGVLDARSQIFLAAVLVCVLIAGWQWYKVWFQKHLPQQIKNHIEILLEGLRKSDEHLLMDPSLHFLAKHLGMDLYDPKYGDPEHFFWDGLIKFLKDALTEHKKSAPEGRLFSVEEIDQLIAELEERLLKPGTVLCFECGAKILPGQTRCSGCGWNWESSFRCPECDVEMPFGHRQCKSCGWSW